ncbi:MAG: 16S rRNA (cytosine(1402)-N(4))-methyltransferase RsmH [Acidobacteria bacterium]|nr:16S rRNA (cytosine(1402)-N(4))-methyltransferase RsmH [Acidobacteriota bacterium]
MSPHRPIMLAEVLRHLQPRPGDVVVDATLGGGGHARRLLEAVHPGGRLIALDVDPIERPRTEALLRREGFDTDVLRVHGRSFAELPDVLTEEHVAGADVILVDLGVSAMQHDTASRGFSYKLPGPLDLRMNPSLGEPASALVARTSAGALAAILREHADEPQAEIIATTIKQHVIETTHGLDRVLRIALARVQPPLAKAEVKRSVRRSFQALRIAVNDEFAALDTLLRVLPACLAPGGRVAIITFHSGEDNRVERAFRDGYEAGVYDAIAHDPVRSEKAETFSNRRAAAARLRWGRKRC